MKNNLTADQRHNEVACESIQCVKERAYQIYLQRGQQPGHELEDWAQAEHEIIKSHQQAEGLPKHIDGKSTVLPSRR